MRALAAVLLLAVLAAPAASAEFTADLVKSDGLTVVTGKILVKGARYRMDLPSPSGPDLVCLMDPAADVSRVLVPRYRLYMEGKCTDPQARMNDPFALLALLREQFTAEDGGTETIAGHECAREILKQGDQPVATVWTATKLAFPLKLVMHQQEGRFTELRNVKVGPVDDALLGVPEGFEKSTREAIRAKLRADPEMIAKRKAWKKARPRKVEISMPLRAGSDVRILLGEATRVSAGLKYDAPDCEWSLQAYRDGNAILPPEATEHKGKAQAPLPVSPVPEVLVAKATAGSGYLGVTAVGREPLFLATRMSYSQKPLGGRSWSPMEGCTKIVVTVAAGEKRAVGHLTLQRVGNEESDKRPIELEPGKSVTHEFGAEDGIENIDVTLQVGGATVTVTEDRRPLDRQKPF